MKEVQKRNVRPTNQLQQLPSSPITSCIFAELLQLLLFADQFEKALASIGQGCSFARDFDSISRIPHPLIPTNSHATHSSKRFQVPSVKSIDECHTCLQANFEMNLFS